MKQKLVKFAQWLRAMSAIKFILVCTALIIAINIAGSSIIEGLGINIDPKNILDFKDKFWFLVITSLIWAPMFETLFYQKFIFFVLRQVKFFDRHKVYIMLISGAVFGVSHYYSIAYMILTTILGFTLMLLYVARFRRNAYWCITIIHFVVNLIALSVNMTQ